MACAFALVASAALAAPRMGPWTKEQAWKWYNAQPWIRGCNYMPASAANRYDMWQVWDSERRFEEMDRELALAESIGFNAVRIIIAEDNGFAVWCEDHDGYMRNLERFLALCGKHKIRAIMCLGNDCSRPKPLWSIPKPGPQPYDIGYHGGRKRSQHGSFPGMIGYISADDPELQPKFFRMCEEVMEKYKDDDRVLFWNIWNEPGNNGRGEVSAPLIKRLFEIAWKVGVKHPCAADIWRGQAKPVNAAERVSMEMSDIISYHTYSPLQTQIAVARKLKAEFGRPLVNTEWMARILGCDVQDCYPFFAQERIGCTCWGFVAGKYQTYEPWEGMWKQVEKGYRGYKMTKWFHDLFRPSLRPYDPEEIDIIKHVNAQMDAEREGKSLRAKVAAKYRIVRQDMWQGCRRTHFDFNGRKAWIAEPSVAPRKDSAWIWPLLWPECDAGRTCVADLLKRGFHYAYIELFDTRMDKAGVEAAAAFQAFLVNELGFAPKANLVGLSWGGFMAAQYAAAKSANVARIYLDNALLTFDGYTPPAKVGLGSWADVTGRVPPAWRDDPRMPVNLAPSIAKAGISVLAVYGTSDAYVRPGANTKPFLAKFTAAGGKATVIAHSEYGHHPHGVEPHEANTVIQFFIGSKKK
ncbi:MAG: cellulase family glycosylhydrolase [Kiritimatiellae bacterium]|nr:cellulase family glycosylhydrolase [Kiritimatiellia bacterium]